MRASTILSAFLLLPFASTCSAQITAGQTVFKSRAIQDVTIFASAPFNPFGVDIFIDDLSGVADWGWDRGAQQGTTIPFSVFGVDYQGSHPGLGSFVFGAAAGIQAGGFTGEIVNVVLDPGDPGFATGDPSSFDSGAFMVGGQGVVFGFEFTGGPFAGLMLRTSETQSFGFEAQLDGLPPSVGTTFVATGDAVLDVVLYDPNNPSATPVVVGRSSDRRIVVIPEPASGWLILSATAHAVARRRRR